MLESVSTSPQKAIARFKMESLLHRNIAVVIKTKLHYIPSLRQITISKVRLTPDMHAADVFYTTSDFKQRFKINRELNKHQFLIRSMAIKNFKSRRAPKLNFQFDHHLVETEQIEKIIDKF